MNVTTLEHRKNWIPAAIGAAGSLLGGALSLAGSRAGSNAHPANQIFWNQEGTRQSMANLRRNAELGGVSPLAMLGKMPTAGPTATVGPQKDYSWIGQAGQQIAQIPQVKAQIEESAAKSDYYRALADQARKDPTSPNNTPKTIQQAGNGAANTDVNIIPKEVVSKRKKTPYIESGSIAEQQFIDTPTGKKPVESEKAGEVYEQQGELAMAARFAQKVAERGYLYARNRITPRHYQIIRDSRPREGTRTGQEYRYDPLSGEYRKAKIGPEGPQTFYNKKLWKNPYPKRSWESRRRNWR